MYDGSMAQMIIQLPMGLGPDDLGDLGVRHRLEEELERAFDEGGIGDVEGGDIGSGTMNVFAIVTAERWTEALAVTLCVLRDMRLDEFALVARCDLSVDGPPPVVVWPE